MGGLFSSSGTSDYRNVQIPRDGNSSLGPNYIDPYTPYNVKRGTRDMGMRARYLSYTFIALIILACILFIAAYFLNWKKVANIGWYLTVGSMGLVGIAVLIGLYNSYLTLKIAAVCVSVRGDTKLDDSDPLGETIRSTKTDEIIISS